MTDLPLFQTGEACAVKDACRNYPAQCWACTWPEDGLRPSEYLPRDPKVEHPLTVQLKKDRTKARKQRKRSDAAKRGRNARARGKQFERDIAKATGGHVQPGSGAFRGNLSNDVVMGSALAHIQTETKYGRSYPVATLYRLLEKGDWVFVQGQQTTFVLSTLPVWELRKWDGCTTACVVSKQVTEWERYLLDTVEKPEAVITAHPRQPKLVLQLVPHWIRHMARAELASVDAAKVRQAMALLGEAME